MENTRPEGVEHSPAEQETVEQLEQRIEELEAAIREAEGDADETLNMLNPEFRDQVREQLQNALVDVIIPDEEDDDEDLSEDDSTLYALERLGVEEYTDEPDFTVLDQPEPRWMAEQTENPPMDDDGNEHGESDNFVVVDENGIGTAVTQTFTFNGGTTGATTGTWTNIANPIVMNNTFGTVDATGRSSMETDEFRAENVNVSDNLSVFGSFDIQGDMRVQGISLQEYIQHEIQNALMQESPWGMLDMGIQRMVQSGSTRAEIETVVNQYLQRALQNLTMNLQSNVV